MWAFLRDHRLKQYPVTSLEYINLLRSGSCSETWDGCLVKEGQGGDGLAVKTPAQSASR